MSADRSLIDMAEILYRARSGLEALGRKGQASAKDALSGIAELAAFSLRASGEDPGKTSEDADALKVSLLRRESPAPPLEDSIGRAAQIGGCDGLVHRAVGRFSEFVQRATFAAKGEYKGIVEDDPWLPVAPWVHERGYDMGDLRQAGVAFADWTKAAGEEFARRRAGIQAPPPKPPPFRLGKPKG